MEIKVMNDQGRQEQLTVEELVSKAPVHIELESRVPKVAGKAFDFTSWYGVWSIGSTTEPTHLKVEAADEFQALIPWGELSEAAFLYEQNGAPLTKGYPIRLYVPDGSSKCLNVKSVVEITILHDASLGGEATYGYKNEISVDSMTLKK